MRHISILRQPSKSCPLGLTQSLALWVRIFTNPVSFLDMVQLEKHAACILTDSGGVQKEAYYHSVSSVTLRDETEWVETVEMGWNQVVGTEINKIVKTTEHARKGKMIFRHYIDFPSCNNLILLLIYASKFLNSLDLGVQKVILKNRSKLTI